MTPGPTGPSGSTGPTGLPGLVHLVPGPEPHGVVRHGLLVHPHLPGAELLRCGRLDELPEGALAGRVVVAQVTDRVVAGSAADGLEVWRRATAGVARLTVVLHDLPQRSDGRSRRHRSELYAALAASADEVVVASRHERLLLAAALRWARPRAAAAVLARTHVIPLPIEGGHPGTSGVARPTVRCEGARASVVTLGYVYPGKGLEEVVDAAAAAARDPRLAGLEVEVLNLGRASDGHEDLLDQLATRARAAGVRWSTSGWVDDADLPGRLAAADVPVAAHQHLSASGSIATWLAAGRRPLVLASRYADELAARLPGALTLVPDVDHLAPAVAAALADPASTWLAPDVRLGPSAADAGALLAEVAGRPAVSVVVPYYRGQPLLDLILDALGRQTGVVGGLEVVVADDGSPQPPDVGAGPGVDVDAPRGAVGSIRVVRQERDGFRAAAARNLGVRHARGRALLLLDGDTVPEEGYVAALQRVCLASPTLALGRRRHAELTDQAGWPHTWPPTRPLEEPAWLADGYRDSDDLRSADDASFRFVISAVMAVSRQLWDVVGGFEEALTGYGGEDWELGWRCWLAGADLRHVPDAVAWHDGPDLAGREGEDAARLAEVKNAETARLAPLLPHPLVRGIGWTHAQPDVVAVLDCSAWSGGQVVVASEALLRLGDVGVWLLDPPPDAAHVLLDPRVHRGHPPAAVRARARAVVHVDEPVAVLRLPWEPSAQDVSGALTPGASPLVADPASGVRVRSTRALGRAELHGEPLPDARWLPADWVEPLPADLVVERWRQRYA